MAKPTVRRSRARRAVAAALGLFALVSSAAVPAFAFPHIVMQGETLASIAERYYGQIQKERLLVAANFLDARAGTPIVRGMRLEIPAVTHRRIVPGDTWETLAAELLGMPSRADVLSTANGSSPWLPPEQGAEIIVPYNLRVVVAEGEQIATIAYRHLGEMNKAWILDRYNGLDGRALVRDDVLLVPLTDLPLTEAGREAATRAAGAACSEGQGAARQAQRRVAAELPALVADVRAGRYADAVTRGTRFLATAALTEPQVAVIQEQLTKAYVALDAVGLAAAACKEWRKRDRGATLDPALTSPKIIRACERAG
jgi:hypothetical protein